MSENDLVVPVWRVTDVRPHPDSDKLDIVTIAGKTNIANRPSPDQPRYKVGDYAVVLDENLILPEALIKHLDMWDHAKNKGGLAGSKGNRTKARKVGGILSEVALCAVEWRRDDDKPVENDPNHVAQYGVISIPMEGGDVATMTMKLVDRSDPNATDITPEGHNVANLLGIAPYEMPKN